MCIIAGGELVKIDSSARSEIYVTTPLKYVSYYKCAIHFSFVSLREGNIVHSSRRR